MTLMYEEHRQKIVDVCLFMQQTGLVVGTAGNVSVRVDDHVIISPSGVPYDQMTAADVCVHDLAGEVVDAKLKPSSELPLHLTVYETTDAQAITHNHAPASTAMGLVVDEIPGSHYYSAMFGGLVRAAPYATFGTDELAHNVAEALKDRSGALMSNHGALTIGPNLDKALGLLQYLEYICEIQLRAMSTGLPVKELSPELMEIAREGFTGYGQSSSAKA